MQKQINAIVIGLGRIGNKYDLKKKITKTHCKSLILNKNFNLVAGVDKSYRNRKIFENFYKLKSFSSIKKALKKNLPEFVVISTPTSIHRKNFLEVIKFNSVKFILIEKPISFNFEDTYFIVDKCEKKKIKLFVNYIRRYNIGLIKLKNILEKNSKIRVKIFYNNGFINSGSHYLNLLRFYFGMPKNFKILNLKKKFKNDFNIALEMQFKKAIVDFKYTSKKIIYDMIFQFNKNTIKHNKTYGINSNNFKIKSSLSNYQKDVLIQIYNNIKYKKSYVCTGKDHIKDMKIIEKIKNEI